MKAVRVLLGPLLGAGRWALAGPGSLLRRQPGSAAAFSTSAAAASNASDKPLAPANVWCIGRNYAAHARELGNDVPTVPMIFLKAGSSVVPPGEVVLPDWTKDVHHEVELAIELGQDLTPQRAAVALDLTARDVQDQLKKQQWPWTLAKSFRGSTPLGPAFSLAGVDPASLTLTLDVNGVRRQTGRTADMIFDVATQIAYIRKHFPVAPGDVLLTGTPPGVSAMRAGDEILARVLAGDGKVLSEAVWRVRNEAQ